MGTVIAGLIDRKEENILVVGNGFDLYHGLKTKYYDFVQYTKERNSNNAFSDVCRENNIIKYFQKVVDKNEGWIDCEERLAYIVKLFSKIITKLEATSHLHIPTKDFTSEERFTLESMDKYFEKTDMNAYKVKEKWINSYKELNKRAFLGELKKELDGVITALDYYLRECVENQNINILSEQIKKLNPKYVVNFNYTNTCERIYGISAEKVLYIHGKVNSQPRNIVLGIKDDDIDNLDFVYFKKYFQCIQKRLEEIDYRQFNDLCGSNCKVYFFGHSLSKTDGERIVEIENLSKQMIIFYRDQEDYEYTLNSEYLQKLRAASRQP